MKNLSCLILFLAAVACKEISYQEPQPRGKKTLQEIPAKLRGKYLLRDEKSSEHDTLVVTNKGYFFSSDSARESAHLSDSLVMKSYKGYYFINMNENPEWILRLIRQDEKGDLHYYTMEKEDRNFNAFLKELGTKIRVDSSEVKGEKLYQIDPSPKQLMGLIRAGYFKEGMLMKKIK